MFGGVGRKKKETVASLKKGLEPGFGLKPHLWDRDLFKWNECAGEGTLNLGIHIHTCYIHGTTCMLIICDYRKVLQEGIQAQYLLEVVRQCEESQTGKEKGYKLVYIHKYINLYNSHIHTQIFTSYISYTYIHTYIHTYIP